jgi:O-antigen/teichoic acid export membrane protein
MTTDLAHRSATGLLVLISRTAFVQIIALAGFFFLSVFLDRADIGIFFAVSEIVALLGFFSDIGLAAALIQKDKEPELEDIRTTFTIQQLLVISLIIIVFTITPLITQTFNLSPQAVHLLWALLAAFFFASLKTIPSVLLERHLHFQKLVIVETIETLLFYGLAVTLAWQGFGLQSYVIAVLARGIAGVATIYYLAPWPLGFALSKKSVKKLLSFGLPYQANTLIAAIKDRFLNILLFKLIGADGMGIIGWAQTWSQKPLRFIMDNVTKVTFPAFSRLQSQPKKLSAAVEKMLFFLSSLTFPTLIGMAVVAQPLIEIIPKYSKWQPALFALYLYIFNSAWAVISTPLTNTLAAIGRITTVTRLMIMWTILTWGIIPVLAWKFSYNGVAIGVAVIATSSTVVVYLVKKHINFSIQKSLLRPLAAAASMGIITLALQSQLPPSILSITLIILSGILSYSFLLHFFTGKELIPHIQLFLKAVRKKPSPN